jgi:hypothetical protein
MQETHLIQIDGRANQASANTFFGDGFRTRTTKFLGHIYIFWLVIFVGRRSYLSFYALRGLGRILLYAIMIMALEIPAGTVGTGRAALVALKSGQLYQASPVICYRNIIHVSKRAQQTYSYFSLFTRCASQLRFNMLSSLTNGITTRIDTGIFGPCWPSSSERKGGKCTPCAHNGLGGAKRSLCFE